MHHTQSKAEKTKELLYRTVKYLIELDDKDGILLNNIRYKKITFSQQQIIDAMNHIATSADIVNKIVLKDKSTFTTNKEYKKIINKAKLERTKEYEKINSTLINKTLNDLQYKLNLEQLIAENHKLKNEIKLLNSILQAEEISRLFETNKPLKNLPNYQDNNIFYILKNILLILSSEGRILIKSNSNNTPLSVEYDSDGEDIKLCNFDEISEQLNLTITSKMLLKDKNELY